MMNARTKITTRRGLKHTKPLVDLFPLPEHSTRTKSLGLKRSLASGCLEQLGQPMKKIKTRHHTSQCNHDQTLSSKDPEPPFLLLQAFAPFSEKQAFDTDDILPFPMLDLGKDTMDPMFALSGAIAA
ncbi:expressed unknown protein [Seminavis robusta]|uniref:Uncharacterized protein n=1 Tax=Seminavis robusta TaxID=568900 RepID=A0A9N8HMJ5_9STRA|nr:expressed unknown protein [Seminavis robusta]|eukprot:Sro904_g218440.1 n/a (127) ;mRNA; r:38886-39266